MKKITKILTMFVIGFMFIGIANAAEVALNGNVATLAQTVGGQNASIIQTDNNATYDYYYKVVIINNDKFKDYVKQRYIRSDRNQEGSTAYVEAAAKISNYENDFKALVPTVNTASDLQSGWTKSTNRQIAITGLQYEANSHNGYVIAVAAVKQGDNNTVYVLREIKESKSATTLGPIEFLDSDKTGTTNTTTDTTTTTTTTTTADTTTTTTDTVTTENPETAVSDWAIFITPISIALGAGILLRRKNYA